MYNSRYIRSACWKKGGADERKEGKGEPMKAKSKLLALLLALVMVFGMAMPAFAADDAATPSSEPTTTEAPAESAEPKEIGRASCRERV